MRICILTPRFPFPQYGGDVLRINEIARYLKTQGHTLVLVSLSDNDKIDVEEAKRLYDHVYYVRRDKFHSHWNSFVSLLTFQPMQCGYYHSPKYAQLLKQVIEKEKPDLYIAHLLRMTPYLEALGLQKRTVVEMTDALSRTYSMSGQSKSNGLLKYVYLLERRAMCRYEQHVIQTFPKVVLVSRHDVSYLNTIAGQNSPSLVVHTNGVRCIEKPSEKYQSNKICFVGNLRSMPNQDAVHHYVKAIFPIIKEKMPGAKFYIVGSLPPKDIQALSSYDIVVTGFVDDLESEIASSAVVVAPIRIAAGIQNKVLIAMAAGVPVVLNELLAHAIPELKDGNNCFISRTDQEMADACISIMRDAALRKQIGMNGYQVVKQNYTWEKNLEGYENL